MKGRRKQGFLGEKKWLNIFLLHISTLICHKRFPIPTIRSLVGPSSEMGVTLPFSLLIL